MNIAIIEYKSDIDEALAYFPPENSLYLSVTAEASYWLSKRNIKFVTDESILQPSEFKNIGDENFEIAEKWIEGLEAALQKENPIFKKSEFYPFKWHFYRLKILLDAVRMRSILIRKLIERERPVLIGIPPGGDAGRVYDHHLFFYKDNSLYGILAERIAHEKGLKIKIWKKAAFNTKRLLARKRATNYLKRLIKKCLRTVSSAGEMRNFSRESNILLGNLYYDIAPAVQKLLNKFNFYVYEGPLSISPLESSLKLKTGKAGYGSLKINGGGLFKNISATGDLLIDEILNQRIENYAKKYIPFLWKGLDYLEELDRRINFRGYIHHAGAYDSFFGLPVYYFRRENKPVIIIQHGAYGFALNRITEYSDFGHDGYFFGWGSGVGSMYEDRKKGSCRIMSTGSSLLDVIRKNRVPQKTISRVCYVPCGPRAYTAYYPNGQPCLDSELFIMEINFLSALKPYLKRYDITYKVAPQAAEVSPLFGESPMPRWVKENLPGIKIELRPLSSVMNEFDLFIIDWPTTTLLQACATGAEVIVYTGNNYHTPTDEAVELLRQRAIVALKHGDFIDKIREVLDKGVVISDVEDTAFLERYGIYKNDGKSLERITAGIEDVFKKP